MVKYKLTYFDTTWLGEPIRFILSYMGKEFEDCRIPWGSEDWPEMKKKIPFGRVPTLEIDGKITYQSTAICRYLANEAGLNGKSDWDRFEIDMVIGTYFDLHAALASQFHEENPEAKEKKKLAIIKETLPYYYNLYDEQIKKNGGYLVNNALTWADLFITALIEPIEEEMGEKISAKYPNLHKLIEKVRSIPNIKKWIEKRPKSA
ncbi:hypothetical protein O3M35_008820 [Rhynocoris fuscipes]|uniref:glutathione transferase n=1 Tax=Rhynocoris fuscipes TaxID=488301 RepID=A0AAW1D8D1_9HEMI